MITTYEEALAAIGTRAADATFPAADLTIRPTNFVKNFTTTESLTERALLDRAALITFE